MAEELSDFVDEYEINEKKMEKYQKLDELVGLDLVSLLGVFVVSAISIFTLKPEFEILGIANFGAYAITICLVLLWGVVLTSLNRRKAN